ncbi:ATP-dependent DNA helicase [Rhizobium bangladeshense]|uniref:ATP-dependent DNA helicase n=1 Tax=Rhizobium bangladeshense TaxID=1138189 RepID=UPI001C82D3D9|nr:AAA family ATPase [Rhizobium bangladeshense]MBX4893803.1 AAA family ATPase [Rhizobium bangladeshense]
MPTDDIKMSDPGMAAVNTSVPTRFPTDLRQFSNLLDESNIVEWVVNHAANRNASFGQVQLKISTARALTHFKRPVQEIDQLFQQVVASDKLTRLDSPDGQPLYTSTELRAAEQNTIRHVTNLSAEESFGVPGTIVDMVADGSVFTPELRGALHYLSRRNRASTLVGVAGSAKTSVLGALNEAVDRFNEEALPTEQIKLIAFVPTNRAAQELREKGLRDVTTTFKAKDRTIGKNTIVVIDEMSMAKTQEIAQLIETVANATSYHPTERPKLICVGDDRQLPPVGPGDLLPIIMQQAGCYELVQPLRQLEARSRIETEKLGRDIRHDAQSAVGHYLTALEQMDLVHFVYAPSSGANVRASDQITDRMLEEMSRVCDRYPVDDRLVMAHSNRSVNRANIALHQRFVDKSGLQDQQMSVWSSVIDSGSSEFGIDEGSSRRVQQRINLVLGDRILFSENRLQADIRNGTFATVVGLNSAEPSRAENGAPAAVRITARLDGSSRTVTWTDSEFRGFTYGYAATIYKSQGATVDHAILLCDGALSDKLTYVGLTRHRSRLDVIASPLVANNVEALSAKLTQQSAPNNSIQFPVLEHAAFQERSSVSNAHLLRPLDQMEVFPTTPLSFPSRQESSFGENQLHEPSTSDVEMESADLYPRAIYLEVFQSSVITTEEQMEFYGSELPANTSAHERHQVTIDTVTKPGIAIEKRKRAAAKEEIDFRKKMARYSVSSAEEVEDITSLFERLKLATSVANTVQPTYADVDHITGTAGSRVGPIAHREDVPESNWELSSTDALSNFSEKRSTEDSGEKNMTSNDQKVQGADSAGSERHFSQTSIVEALEAGDHKKLAETLAATGSLVEKADAGSALKAMADAYERDIKADPEKVRMLYANRRVDVDALAKEIEKQGLASGRLSGDPVTFKAFNNKDIRFRVGDRLSVTSSYRNLIAGEAGRIEKIEGKSVTFKPDGSSQSKTFEASTGEPGDKGVKGYKIEGPMTVIGSAYELTRHDDGKRVDQVYLLHDAAHGINANSALLSKADERTQLFTSLKDTADRGILASQLSKAGSELYQDKFRALPDYTAAIDRIAKRQEVLVARGEEKTSTPIELAPQTPPDAADAAVNNQKTIVEALQAGDHKTLVETLAATGSLVENTNLVSALKAIAQTYERDISADPEKVRALYANKRDHVDLLAEEIEKQGLASGRLSGDPVTFKAFNNKDIRFRVGDRISVTSSYRNLIAGEAGRIEKIEGKSVTFKPDGGSQSKTFEASTGETGDRGVKGYKIEGPTTIIGSAYEIRNHDDGRRVDQVYVLHSPIFGSNAASALLSKADERTQVFTVQSDTADRQILASQLSKPGSELYQDKFPASPNYTAAIERIAKRQELRAVRGEESPTVQMEPANQTPYEVGHWTPDSQKSLVEALEAGDHKKLAETLAATGSLVEKADAGSALKAMADAYERDIKADPEKVRMLYANRRVDVDALAKEIEKQGLASGRLSGDPVTFKAFNNKDIRFRVGDRLSVTSSYRNLIAGEAGRIEKIEGKSVTFKPDGSSQSKTFEASTGEPGDKGVKGYKIEGPMTVIGSAYELTRHDDGKRVDQVYLLHDAAHGINANSALLSKADERTQLFTSLKDTADRGILASQLSKAGSELYQDKFRALPDYTAALDRIAKRQEVLTARGEVIPIVHTEAPELPHVQSTIVGETSIIRLSDRIKTNRENTQQVDVVSKEDHETAGSGIPSVQESNPAPKQTSPKAANDVDRLARDLDERVRVRGDGRGL